TWSAPAFGASLGHRRGGEGILGPAVLGIAGLELLFDLSVAPGPKALEVAGDLNGLVAGREQVQHHGHPAFGHPRRLQPTEAFLQADRKDGGEGAEVVVAASASATGAAN